MGELLGIGEPAALEDGLEDVGGRQDSLTRHQPTNDENNSRSQAVVGAEEESPLTHGSCQGVLAAAVSEACVG